MAIKKLLRAFKQQNVLSQQSVPETFHEPPQLSHLCHLLVNQETTPASRAYAAIALGHSGKTLATTPLMQALRDSSAQVRASAALALGYLQEPSSGPALFDALQDQDPYVRDNAASSLRKMGYIECLESLPFLKPFMGPALLPPVAQGKNLPPILTSEPSVSEEPTEVQLNLTGEMPAFHSWLNRFNCFIERGGNVQSANLISENPIMPATEPESLIPEPQFVWRVLPPLLGYHRILLTLVAQVPTAMAVKITVPTAEHCQIRLGDVSHGRFSGTYILLEPNQETEICFRLVGTEGHDYPVGFQLADPFIGMVNTMTDLSFAGEQAPMAAPPLATLPWQTQIPELFHPVLDHLRHHGAVTEKTVVDKLGGASQGMRQARKFAVGLSDWLPFLPFQIEIHSTPEGKEYRKIG